MPLTKVSADEFQQALGGLSDGAGHEPKGASDEELPSVITSAAKQPRGHIPAAPRLLRLTPAMTETAVGNSTRTLELRRVGLTTELSEEWIEAVRNASVPDEWAHLDAELQ